jgi:hypothetical protein
MFLGVTKSLPYLLLFPWLCFTLNSSFWLLRRSISNDVWDICSENVELPVSYLVYVKKKNLQNRLQSLCDRGVPWACACARLMLPRLG